MLSYMENGKRYGGLRLGEATLERLKDMRLAFESSYMERMTNDLFIERLIACVEEAEPAVWENYCKIGERRGDA